MTKSPVLWGLGLACALGGAIAGNAVGSAPVTDRPTIQMLYQAHKTASIGPHGQRLLPNHYPLVTRAGVVEVAKLSDRGLFRQARYRPSSPGAGYASDANDGDPGLAFDDDAMAEPVAATGYAPAQAALDTQGFSQVSGHAKIIDVQAMLAMR